MPAPKKSAATSSTSSEPAALTPAPVAAPVALTHEARVEQTVRWLLTGNRDADIVEAIGTHWPDADLPAIVRDAISNLAQSAQAEPDVVRGWCFEATKHLYARMVEIGDFAGALRAVKQLKELAGQ